MVIVGGGCSSQYLAISRVSAPVVRGAENSRLTEVIQMLVIIMFLLVLDHLVCKVGVSAGTARKSWDLKSTLWKHGIVMIGYILAAPVGADSVRKAVDMAVSVIAELIGHIEEAWEKDKETCVDWRNDDERCSRYETGKPQRTS
jgi:hypothetical protein